MSQKNDNYLIKKYLKGDKPSLEALIKKYLKPIYSFVYKYVDNKEEAEDITQEVFLKMWRNIKKFDQQKNFKTWIFIIARNSVIDHFRKKKEIPFSKFENYKEEGMIIKDMIDTPFESFLNRFDIIKEIDSALNKLHSRYSKILFLRYKDGFTFKEIAKKLGESLNTIRSRHRRALIQLKKILIEANIFHRD
jgi:RNA polymerase sigma-70 factor (ECF subfamily)